MSASRPSLCLSPTQRFGRFQTGCLRLPGVGPDELAVLTVLSTYVDPNGECWPSQQTVASDLNHSRPWVIKIIGRLQWLSKAIIRDGDMLSIPPEYFSLGPIECRLYDLAYVKCCDGERHTTVGALQTRARSDMRVRQFKAYLGTVGRDSPGYEVLLLDEFEAPAPSSGKKRGGRPSVALMKVVVRPRAPLIEHADPSLEEGDLAASEKSEKQTKHGRRRKPSPPLDSLDARTRKASA